jgi:hypothetical protein
MACESTRICWQVHLRTFLGRLAAQSADNSKFSFFYFNRVLFFRLMAHAKESQNPGFLILYQSLYLGEHRSDLLAEPCRLC